MRTMRTMRTITILQLTIFFSILIFIYKAILIFIYKDKDTPFYDTFKIPFGMRGMHGTPLN